MASDSLGHGVPARQPTSVTRAADQNRLPSTGQLAACLTSPICFFKVLSKRLTDLEPP